MCKAKESFRYVIFTCYVMIDLSIYRSGIFLASRADTVKQQYSNVMHEVSLSIYWITHLLT